MLEARRADTRRATIPIRNLELFKEGITHPDLWLWDSWVRAKGDDVDLYCLALARRTLGGEPIFPGERNQFPFHVRQFQSDDGGHTWRDAGAVFAPGAYGDGYCDRNIWSGSCLDLGRGRRLHALTGLRNLDPSRPFLQSLFLAETAPGSDAPTLPDEALLCPMRDYATIRETGYFLGPKPDLGSAEGEEGGPILAWRDPFIWKDDGGLLHLIWSAKASSREACIGHAIIERVRERWRALLQPPILLPAGETITQAEVPKLHALQGGGFVMLVSGCDRLSETQPDHEVNKTHNFYRSDGFRGPWRPFGASSVVEGQRFLYGGSLLDPIVNPQEVRMIAPYSERVDADRQLTFAPIQRFGLMGGRAP